MDKNPTESPKRVIAWGRILAVVVVIAAIFAASQIRKGVQAATVASYEKIDPFQDFYINTSGISPDGELEYKDISGNDFLMQYVTYSADKTTNLTNGDVITFTAEANPKAVKEFKTDLSRTVMQYTVEDLPFYITPDTVLTEEQLQALKSGMEDYVSDFFTNADTTTWDLAVAACDYLGVLKVNANSFVASSVENVEFVVMPEDSDFNFILLGNATGTLYSYGGKELADFNGCFRIRFYNIQMQGNQITSWERSGVSFWPSVDDAVINLRVENPKCKVIEIPET